MKNKSQYKIIKRNGKVDVEIPDGIYSLKAIVTIQNGILKYIDDGIWSLLSIVSSESKKNDK